MIVVIITGGGGFLGQSLATSLLANRKICAGSDAVETEISRIILADVAFPPVDHNKKAKTNFGVSANDVSSWMPAILRENDSL